MDDEAEVRVINALEVIPAPIGDADPYIDLRRDAKPLYQALTKLPAGAHRDEALKFLRLSLTAATMSIMVAGQRGRMSEGKANS